jgi:hypothetical protein
MWSDPTASAAPAPPSDFAPLTQPLAPSGYAPLAPSGYPPLDPAYPPAQYPVTAPPAAYGGYAGYGAYAPPGAYQVYPVAPKTNGLATASMIVSIVSIGFLFCYGLGAIVGIVGAILGHIARRQIRTRGEAGAGMALAGIITGWVATAIGIAILAVIGWAFAHVFGDIQRDPYYN